MLHGLSMRKKNWAAAEILSILKTRWICLFRGCPGHFIDSVAESVKCPDETTQFCGPSKSIVIGRSYSAVNLGRSYGKVFSCSWEPPMIRPRYCELWKVLWRGHVGFFCRSKNAILSRRWEGPMYSPLMLCL